MGTTFTVSVWWPFQLLFALITIPHKEIWLISNWQMRNKTCQRIPLLCNCNTNIKYRRGVNEMVSKRGYLTGDIFCKYVFTKGKLLIWIQISSRVQLTMIQLCLRQLLYTEQVTSLSQCWPSHLTQYGVSRDRPIYTCNIQSSVVIARSNIIWFCIWCNND